MKTKERDERGDGAVRDDAPANKKPRVARSSNEVIGGKSIEAFHRSGFVVVPSFLTEEELQFLRNESDQLFEALDADPAAATQKIVDLGCVLDPMAKCPIADDAAARTDMDLYLRSRAEQTGDVSLSPFTLQKLLFHRLPELVRRLLDTSDLYFFNEHYIVKPPHTAVEFRWHRDDDEQLGMCVHRDDIAPYVSAWCALDDVVRDSGPLRFVALDRINSSGDVDVDHLEELASKPLAVEAGTVVLFLSSVWHFSSSNTSPHPRRAFYAQYTREPVTATPRDEAPLSFAIPCGGIVNGDQE